MKVRVKAWIENCGNGFYRMRCNDGAETQPTTDLQSLQKQADFINNEDTDNPRYIEMDDEPSEEEKIQRRREYEIQEAKRLKEERALEREKKEKERIEKNRKSIRSDDKYVFVISCVQRGASNSVGYFTGETDLLKITKNNQFVTKKIESARVYKTKATAQKIVDNLESTFIVNQVYRNFRVSRKKKELFWREILKEFKTKLRGTGYDIDVTKDDDSWNVLIFDDNVRGFEVYANCKKEEEIPNQIIGAFDRIHSVLIH